MTDLDAFCAWLARQDFAPLAAHEAGLERVFEKAFRWWARWGR